MITNHELVTQPRRGALRSLRRVYSIVVLLLGGAPLLPVGCQSAADEPRGTESHFLSACEDDSDCGSLQCFDSVCSASCESSSDCAELASASSCELTNSGGSCVLECSADADCSGLGAEDCSGGYCEGYAGGAANGADDGNSDDDVELLQSSGERELAPVVTDEDIDAAALDNADFAWELYSALAAGSDENMVLSPYSISTAMAMAYAGARGETEGEMAEVLHYGLPQERLHTTFNALALSLDGVFERFERSRLNMHNSLWAQNGLAIEADFLDTLTVNYGSGLYAVDFAGDPSGAREVINDWVRVKTEDKIPDLLPDGSITPNTKLVLTNTIHLLARWQHQFEESATDSADFSVDAATEVEVDTMYMVEYLDHYAEEGLSVARLPYEDTRVGMWILLPELGDLGELEASLSGERLDAIADGFSRRAVDLALPKFSTTSEYRLKDALSELGMPSAFDDRADFSGISDDLSISNVYHDAFIGVDEHGTEASAATAVVFGDASAAFFEDIVPFVVDRPFVFLIRDERTKALLFVGRVTDPR